MKFTPESLLEIYLNGSFTEEAQAEFDRLMRKDPAFAERVTQAVAERVGPPPASLEKIGANLDSKIDALWQAHKPSPLSRWLVKAFQLVLVVAACGGLYGGFKLYWAHHHAIPIQGNMGSSETGVSAPTGASGITGGTPVVQAGSKKTSGANTTVLEKAAKNPSKAPNASVVTHPLLASAGSTLSTPPPMAGSENNPISSKISGAHAEGEGAASPGGSATALQQPSVSTVPPVEEGDTLRVSIETDKAQNVVVTVLDSNGLLVRHLYQGPWSAGVHLVDWDGKDEIGNPVLPGNYTVVVNAEGKTLSGTVVVQPNR